MYKAQTHGGKKLSSGEHEEMLSHSVHDAEGAIKTASRIEQVIQGRKDFFNKHPQVPGHVVHVPSRRRDVHAPSHDVPLKNLDLSHPGHA
jgi:hypothetical protein